MKITILFILALIISAEAISIKQKKQELTNLCTKISHSQVVPDNKKKEFNSYIEQIKQQRENTAALAGIGLIAGLFLAPFIAPAFAAAGLFGAAATSSGLAAMGGGSNKFTGWDIPQILKTNANGNFSAVATETNVVIIGVGNEVVQGNDSVEVKITVLPTEFNVEIIN